MNCDKPKLRDVRFGSKADMCSALAHVRFGPIADVSRFILVECLVGESDRGARYRG
jgi:hypothetical protein